MNEEKPADSTDDTQLAIYLEPISNVYPEQNGTYILSRVSTFRLNLEHEYTARAEISLTFFALTKECYANFPLHLYIYINGNCTEIVALEQEFDRATARFLVGSAEVLNVGVRLRNRVLPPTIDDLRSPAIGLAEVTAKRLTNNEEPKAAPYVYPSGPESRRRHENFFNVDSSSAEPIFVIGSPRSGTSILTWAIGSHPNIYPIEETNFFPLLAISSLANYHHANRAEGSFVKRYDVDRQTFMQRHGAMMHEFICSIVNEQHRFNAHIHFAGVEYTDGTAFTLARAAEDSKKRWVDGAPINTSVSYLLSMMYPRAKFIHLIRHPVSTISSLMTFDRAGGTALTYDEAIDEWDRQVRYGRLLEAALGSEKVMTIRHEDLSAITTENMRNIFQFLDEPYYEPSRDRFLLRINSSSVDPQFREELVIRFETHERRSQLLALHEGPLTVSRSAAIDELTNVLNDIGVRLLKTVFGYQVDSIF